MRFDHAHKNNRPPYMLAQNWVSLGASLDTGRVVPLLSRLVPGLGNRNKVTLARALARAVAPTAICAVRLLCDSWFMRARLVLPLLKRKIDVIGQALRGTALFLPPPLRAPHQRGRPLLYGELLRKEGHPWSKMTLPLYGKPDQKVRYCTAVCLARFLKGTWVRAVWCEFVNKETGACSTARLLLSTDTTLSAQEVLTTYVYRGGIEPMFYNLKRWFGVANLWHATRRVLERMMALRNMAWSPIELLQYVAGETLPVFDFAPWRTRGQVTGCLVAHWLRLTFSGLRFRADFDPKSRKFTMPAGRF